MGIKEQLDVKVQEAGKEFLAIQKSLPHLFRVPDSLKNRRAFLPIQKEDTPSTWRSRINELGQTAKDTLDEESLLKEFLAEYARKTQDLFSKLMEGYDIQGRALLALCKIGGVSFDKLIAMYSDPNFTTDIQEEEEQFPFQEGE